MILKNGDLRGCERQLDVIPFGAHDYGLHWRIYSAAAAQTATIPKKKAAPSYFPLMTLITPRKIRHD